MQHLTGDPVAQDGPTGLTGSLPAEVQSIWAEGSENQRSRGTGGAQGEGGTCKGTGDTSESQQREPGRDLHGGMSFYGVSWKGSAPGSVK